MPSFNVCLNDKPLIVAGDDDIDILTLGVIKGPALPNAFLQITSMKKAIDKHDLWINRPLFVEDVLAITWHQGGTFISPIEDTVMDVNNIGIVHPRVTSFLINSANQKNIFARVDDESTLHVAATWSKLKDQCNVEIACTRVTDKGQNELWVEYELEYDQLLQIKLKGCNP